MDLVLLNSASYVLRPVKRAAKVLTYWSVEVTTHLSFCRS